jgi:phytoene synthase
MSRAAAATEPIARRRAGLPIGMELKASMRACRGVVRSRARNFYYGLRLTPEPKRSALYAVYAWMRAADDIADGPGSTETRLAELRRFEEMTDAAFAAARDGGVASGERWAWAGWSAFVAAARMYDLPRPEFDAVIAALRTDLAGEGPAGGARVMFDTMEQLEDYCRGVAGTVGVVCVSVWGVRRRVERETLEKLAVQRGLAFQLTNVLRDIGEDAATGRVYVPAEVLEAHGLTGHALAAWSSPADCMNLVRELAGEARAHYAASAELDRLVHRDGAATLWAMTRIYAAVLEQLERDPRRVTASAPSSRDARATLSATRKVSIAGRAMLRSALGVR